MAGLVASTSFVSQPDRLSKWLQWEVEPDHTRRTRTLLAGSGAVRDVTSGQVLGKVTEGGVQTVTVGTTVGAGTGVLTLANPKADAGILAGEWQVRFSGKATNAGVGDLFDPTGKARGKVTVGVAFTGPIKFTVADSGTDWDEADYIPITVSYASSDKFVGLDLSGTDGREVAAAIAIYDAEAADGTDGTVTTLEGLSLVNQSNLTWPGGITSNQIAAAMLQLDAVGIRATPDCG